MSTFSHVPTAPSDAIFGLVEKYRQDASPSKVDVVVGAYRTEEGKPYVLNVVRKAEQLMLDDKQLNKEYLPISGDPQFNSLAAKLIFGDSSVLRENRVATVQAISGTGALRLAAEFLTRFFPKASLYLPKPTWGNHPKIFELAGCSNVHEYRYIDSKTNMLDFDGLMKDFRDCPEGSVILLHACAHNPTGVDPSVDQWKEIAQCFKERKLIGLFDCAYQGYATGDLDRDAFAVRHFVDVGVPTMTAQSFSKNLGLYCERAGALSIVASSAEEANAIVSQLKLIIRPMYSNPPAHGARIVSTVLSDPTLFKEWEEELKGMSGRILKMRQKLYDCIVENKTPGDWSHLLKQIGMFTFTGLSPTQVDVMMNKHHVYMLRNGRISVAGLSEETCHVVAKAIHDVVTNYT